MASIVDLSILHSIVYSRNSSTLIVHSGSYIASGTGIMLDTEWQGFRKGLFGSGLFMLRANGVGDLFVNAYGGIIQKNLGDNEKIILDNHHLVALSENSNYKVVKFGGLKTTILGGGGLVTEITGPGSVYFQTKNIPDFVNYLGIKQTSGSDSTWRYDST